jgi:hypothetical protein
MSLKIIGTGFGRTGTKSLKLALEMLGFGPCHHMAEVKAYPEQVPAWRAAGRGDSIDWGALLEQYESCVDWPSVRFWRELSDRFPGARIIHTIRPEDDWYRSVQETIYPRIRSWPDMPAGTERDRLQMAEELIDTQTFDGRLGDPAYALTVYRNHSAAVKHRIAPERRLVFEVAEGWVPLCQFLGVAVPDTPFPHINTTDDFLERDRPSQPT